MKKDEAKELRKRAKHVTVSKLKASMTKEGKRDSAGWPIQMTKEVRLGQVAGVIAITDGAVQRTTKALKKYGGSDKVVAFGQGVHSGLDYSRKVAQSASRGGRLIDHKGRSHKQRRGTVIH